MLGKALVHGDDGRLDVALDEPRAEGAFVPLSPICAQGEEVEYQRQEVGHLAPVELEAVVAVDPGQLDHVAIAATGPGALAAVRFVEQVEAEIERPSAGHLELFDVGPAVVDRRVGEQLEQGLAHLVRGSLHPRTEPPDPILLTLLGIEQ